MNIEEPEELIGYLRDTARLDPAMPDPKVRPLAGGVSNRTVLIEWSNRTAWVVKQALPKLRVADDWFCDPSRIEREALGLQWLGRFAPAGAIPRLLFNDPSHHLLAMEAVPAPHDNWKTLLLAGDINPDVASQFGALLGGVHHLSAQAREVLPEAFRDRVYFEALRLAPYYETTATRNPGAAPFLRSLIEETRSIHHCLVHGDYSPKNILVRQTRLVLLDHEVIHLGDPAFDVGFSLTHLLSKARHIADRRDAFVDAARLHWAAYQNAFPSGLPSDIESRAIRHTLACLLARVDGRSPLEYLTPSERDHQRRFTLRHLASPMKSMPELFDEVAGLT